MDVHVVVDTVVEWILYRFDIVCIGLDIVFNIIKDEHQRVVQDTIIGPHVQSRINSTMNFHDVIFRKCL